MVLERFKSIWLKIVVHVISLVPLLVFVFDYLTNPVFSGNIQRLEFRTGRLALIWLILSLVCSPIYWITKYHEIPQARKTLGLYAFLYAILHAAIFLWLDYAFDFQLIWLALKSTLYLIVGIVSFVILFILAITSNSRSRLFLKKYWNILHKLVYLAAIMGIFHYFLIEKSDIRWPITAAAILAILLILRIPIIRDFLSGHKPEI